MSSCKDLGVPDSIARHTGNFVGREVRSAFVSQLVVTVILSGGSSSSRFPGEGLPVLGLAVGVVAATVTAETCALREALHTWYTKTPRRHQDTLKTEIIVPETN